RPVAALRARVLTLRTLSPGDTVGYGGDWRAERDTVVATLGLGYADGLARAVQNRASVLVGGVRRPVIGRGSMDLTTIDAGPPTETAVRVGDVATMVGWDGSLQNTWEDLAGWAGTNTYEVLSRLGQRLPRVYLGD